MLVVALTIRMLWFFFDRFILHFLWYFSGCLLLTDSDWSSLVEPEKTNVVLSDIDAATTHYCFYSFFFFSFSILHNIWMYIVLYIYKYIHRTDVYSKCLCDLINLRIDACICWLRKTIVQYTRLRGGVNYHYIFSMLVVLNDMIDKKKFYSQRPSIEYSFEQLLMLQHTRTGTGQEKNQESK